MRAPMALLILIIVLGCAGTVPSNKANNSLKKADQSESQKDTQAAAPGKPVKSPHGYIITKDYDLGRFGGFVGECTDDQNWPYFWQCMSENAGNGGFN